LDHADAVAGSIRIARDTVERMGLASRVVIVAAFAAGCHPVSIVAQPNVPTLAGEGTRCRNAAGQDQPLVTEWPASEKANLENQIQQNNIIITFSNYSITILTQYHTKKPYF